ncbi:MAG: hypothetical protein ACKVU4_07305 [Phycisphaerales bacterium]
MAAHEKGDAVKKVMNRVGGGREGAWVLALLACVMVTRIAAAQMGPQSLGAPCTPTAAPQQEQRDPTEHWYPDPPVPPAPYYSWADRTPTAEIRLFNGNFSTSNRGQTDLWWDGQNSSSPQCSDAIRDTKSGFNVETGQFSGTTNGRPDQFDWLIANLQDRFDRGYRRIVLFMPAGVVACQDFPASQWWPMAQWRRNWFDAIQITTPGHAPEQGVKGWIQDHPTVEMGLYMGWPIGPPCSICVRSNASLQSCLLQLTDCVPQFTGLWYRCAEEWVWTHAPDTTNQSDLKVVWQNIQPWRNLGVTRFWIDASSGAASDGLTEFREFVHTPNFSHTQEPAVFGGEAFPIENTTPLPPDQRYSVAWGEFDYAPYVISLPWAEFHQMNGEGCPPDPTPINPHTWNLGTTPVREAAVFPVDWPTCPNGSYKPQWDEPWERLKNLYDWYICRGFSFWQGDLGNAKSGPAERFFSFGKIKPAGDFNGDGNADGFDIVHYTNQYTEWVGKHLFLAPNETLTYFHGDMNSDGKVEQHDWNIAFGLLPFPHDQPVIGNAAYPYNNDTWWLGDPVWHTMLWNPNEKWLPCCCVGGGANGPSGPP